MPSDISPKRETERREPASFMKRIIRFRNDARAMRAFRAAASRKREIEAWPWLSQVCTVSHAYRPGKAGWDYNLARFLASSFAIWPCMAESGRSMGRVLKELGDERKFACLINAGRYHILDLLPPVIAQARSKSVMIDYFRLEDDLYYWSHCIPEWAADFWGNPDVPVEA